MTILGHATVVLRTGDQIVTPTDSRTATVASGVIAAHCSALTVFFAGSCRRHCAP
jgi:hypothetical protein